MREQIKKSLDWWINEKHIKKFVIYPFGGNGKITKDVLNNDFGIKELFVVDSNKSNEEDGVYDLQYLKERIDTDDFMVLLAVHRSSQYYIEIHRDISFIPTDRMIDIFSISTFYNPWKYYEQGYFKEPKISIIEMISREVYERGLIGEVAEAGVYRGNTAMLINRLFPDRKLYLFDTFEGFNDEDLNDESANNRYHSEIDFGNTNETIVMRRMIYPQQCIIKKGWFPQTAEGISDKFCFVRLDMDLYAPTIAGLNWFYERINEGYICIHDCRSRNFDGARDAVREFCDEKGLGFVCLPDELGTAVISINKKQERVYD